MSRPTGRLARSGRSGRFSSLPAVACIATALLLAFHGSSTASDAGGSVKGTLTIQGKSLSFTHVWLVRGPETSDESKPATYLILSSEDLASAISACPSIRCVLWDTVKKNAAILEPLDEKSESFWLRVLSPQLPKEYQLSGRRWSPQVQTRERVSGKLQFSYSNTGDEADLDLDAILLKEFPIPGSHR
ncbi:MAG TPA: hypothetical protein VJA66_05540 [Thermoanaerobaculia bacterium]